MSVQRDVLNLYLKMFIKPSLSMLPLTPTFLSFARPHIDRLGSLFFPAPESVVVEPISVNGVDAEWVSIDSNVIEDRVVLYMHGGAHIIGSPKTHRSITGRLALLGRMRVLSINYRKAPENPFPAPLEDAVNAYDFLLESGYRPENIIIAGDSAGGHLAISLLIKIRDSGREMAGGGMFFSPWLDMSVSGESVKSNTRIDPFLPASRLKEAAKMVLGGLDPHDPLASPLFAELHDLPPLLVQVGDSEVLFDDSKRFADKAKESGVDVEFNVWEGMCHDFQLFADYIPQSYKALLEAGRFMESRFRSVPLKPTATVSKWLPEYSTPNYDSLGYDSERYGVQH